MQRIITVFARHLRQTLYEGSMPFLPLSETIEHIQTHFDLMHLLTGKRISCDIDDGTPGDLTRSRHTATFLLSDWAQRTLWPYFQLANEASNPSETTSSKWTFLAMNSLFATPLPSPCTCLKAATMSTSNTASPCSGTRAEQTGITSRVEEAVCLKECSSLYERTNDRLVQRPFGLLPGLHVAHRPDAF